jgi:acetolactate synthase-1/2/3 large subunit
MVAAAAYARTTGKLGVVLVTSGPGVINAMTGLASAHCDGLPVLLLAGEVARSNFGKKALQEGTADHLNIVAMSSAITKLAIQIREPHAAPATLRRAIGTAMSGRRGPVLVTLPMDVTTTPISVPHIGSAMRVECSPPAETLDRVAHVLEHARRPVLFVGSGVRWDDGPARVRALAEALQVPVMTTPKAKGVFPEDHPLSLGVFGYGGHPSTTDYLRGGVDVTCAIGTGLSDTATDGWSELLHPSKQFIQIDIDGLQLGRNYQVDLGVVGPASQVCRDLGRRLAGLERPRLTLGVRTHEDPALAGNGPSGQISPQRALWELQQLLPADALYTCDIGEHLLFAVQYLRINDPHGFTTMSGLGSMGSSLGSAMGVKLARPNRTVAAICGDGCFAMALADLSTCAQEGLPLIIAVLNDQRYGMVEIGHEAVFGRRPPYPIGPMSVPELARALGGEAHTVWQAGDILHLDLGSKQRRGPLVLDIRIDPAVKMPKNKRNEALSFAISNKPALVN